MLTNDIKKSDEKMKDSSDSLLRDLLEKDKLAEDVYHYTNCYENIINIMKERRLIMSMHTQLPEDVFEEISHDNEDDEISYALDILRRHVLWNKELKYPSQKISQLKTFGQCVEFYVKNLRFFTTSFSLNRDNSKLWQTFGGKNSGFCLRIGKDHFEDEPYFWNPKKPPNITVRISYGADALHRVANLYLEKIKHLEIKSNDPSKYWNVLIDIFTDLISRLPESLRKDYEPENEYRLYAMDIGFSPEQRISQDIISCKNRRYILYSDKIHPKNLKEILIGSKNDFDRIKHKMQQDLYHYFSEEELSAIEIKRSEV
jgi:hypothetical protein